MAQLVCIQTFTHRYEAELAMGRLHADGIHAWVMADDYGFASYLLLGTGGARLMVPGEAAARARELVETGYPIPSGFPATAADGLPIVAADRADEDRQTPAVPNRGPHRVVPKRRRGRASGG